MSTVKNVQNRVANLPQGHEERVLLKFLLDNAVGKSNAKPWPVIESYLKANNISMTQRRFQQGILKHSRENEVFIGSKSHGKAKGYYLIHTYDDAKAMLDWYIKRRDVEQNRINNLKALAKKHSWHL